MPLSISANEATANSSNPLLSLAGRTAAEIADGIAQTILLKSMLGEKSVVLTPAAGVTIAWTQAPWTDVEALIQAEGFTVNMVPGQNRSTISWT